MRWKPAISAVLACVFVILSGVSLRAQASFETITAENAPRLVPVGSLGTGRVQRAYYEADSTITLISMGSRWHYPRAEDARPAWSLLGHVNFETTAISPDRRWFVSQNGDLWDQAQQTLVSSFSPYNVARAVFSADSTRLAAQVQVRCDDTANRVCSRLWLWDVAQQAVRFSWPIEALPDIHLVDEDRLLAVADETQTTFYDVSSGAEVFTLPVRLWGWSENGTAALSGGGTYEQAADLTVWDMARRVPRFTLSFRADEIMQSAALNADGSRLVVSSHPLDPDALFPVPNGTVTVWDARGQRLFWLNQPDVPLNVVGVSPDGAFLAAYGRGIMGQSVTPLLLYAIGTPEPLWALPLPHWRGLYALEFRADSRALLVTYGSGALHEVDVRSGRVTVIAPGTPGYAEDILFGEDTIIISTGRDLFFWDSDTLAFKSVEPDCALMVAGSPFGLHVCQRDDNRNERFLSNGLALEQTSETSFSIWSSDVSRDEQRVAAASDSRLMVWDARTGRLQQQKMIPNANFSRRMAFTADGRFLIAGDQATIWAMPDMTPVAQVTLDSLWYSQFAFSEAGDWLAFPTQDSHVYLWRLRDRLLGQNASADNAFGRLPLSKNIPRALEQVQGPSYVFMDASPDGRLIAVTGYDGILIYEVATQTLLMTLTDGGNVVRFSPDGRFVIVGDGTWCCGFADESDHMGRGRVWGVPVSPP